jgi:hypothetical protein
VVVARCLPGPGGFNGCVHDMHRDLFQLINMVENVVVVAIRLATGTKKPAIDLYVIISFICY